MDGYFATYPRVREYMDEAIAAAKEKGYVQTLFGRRREVPELTSANPAQRGFGERVALNMPLQGTASDIVKLAMLKVFKGLTDGRFRSKLIMQVHDELIVDALPQEADAVAALLKECMENVVKLNVALKVSIGKGANWLDAK